MKNKLPNNKGSIINLESNHFTLEIVFTRAAPVLNSCF